MRKIVSLTAAAALVLAFGFAGTAKADPTVEQLGNPGAEDTVLAPWSTSDPAGGVINNAGCGIDCAARTGDWFFNTDLGSAGVPLPTIPPGSSVTIDQDVDVTGCGVKGLDGSWEADGFVFTDSGADTGQLVVLLSDASGMSSAEINSQNPAYVAMGPLSGPIAAVVTNANVSMIGKDQNDDENAFADFDDMSFRITCIADFAKISGVKNVQGGKGGGSKDKGPQWAFSGIVGTFDDPSATTTGTIVINYRRLGPTSCEFTPSAPIVYDGTGGATVTATYLCTGGTKDTDTGTAVIDLTNKGDAGCPGKDRGSVAVDASDDDLDITGLKGNTDGENCLARGNVIIDDDVQG